MKRWIPILAAGLCLAGCNHQNEYHKQPKTIDPEKAAIRKVVPPADSKHVELAGQAMNGFSISLLKEAAKERPGENITLCPLSLSQDLAMLYDSAGGETKEALARVLGVKGLDSNALASFHSNLLNRLETDPYETMKMANGIWVKPRYPIDSAAAKKLDAIYGCSPQVWDDDSAKAQKTIDDWAERQTGGSIKHLDLEVKSDHFIALLNALTFKGAWANEFDPSMTVEDDFITPAGQVKAQMMSSKEINLPWAQIEGGEAVEMPFVGDQYSFIAILPDEGGKAESIANQLSARALGNCLKDLRPFEVSVRLPKLNLLATNDFAASLERLGLGRLFDKLLLPKLLPSLGENGRLSDVKQQIRLAVDEKGAKAEVVTQAAGVDAAPMRMDFNRPFLYFIVYKPTGTVVLCGIVNDPTKN